MKKKFYYIDKNGKKKKYVGQVINNPDGTFSGILTTATYKDTDVELEYHPEVKAVGKVSAHYSYTNNLGEDIWYNGEYKYEGTKPYFTYTSTTELNLKVHGAVEACNEWYTYTLNGEQHVYLGEVKYNEKSKTYEGVKLPE